jgi:membrane protease YdiL (CAAX protease family)
LAELTPGKILAAHGLAILVSGIYLALALGGWGGLFGLLLAAFGAIVVLLSLVVTALVGGAAYLVGGEGGAEVRLPPEWVALAPLALNSLVFASLVTGGFSHALLFAISFPLLFLAVKPKFPPASMTLGVVGGFAAFVAVLLLSYMFGYILDVQVDLGQLIALSPLDAKQMQLYGWYMLLVVAAAEEMWRAATYYNLVPAVGKRAAAALATAWFVWMHLPGRILYGPLAPAILLLIGAGTLVMWYLCKGDYWGMVAAHAVYNTAIASFGRGMMLVELALLATFVWALWVERRRPKIEIAATVPAELREVVARG